ncbi:MAG: putative toxin-antitoxin system toxin component, PIN family [Pyrinomonadaceae bacterium]|nr:putative toxin-antitoxin system toxin component, PIN family [Pyrinomonadaceae bacterium]
MTDAVFDTVIYLQATLSDKGAAYACWQLVEKGEVRVFITEAILAEIEDVLNRPKLRKKYSVLTDEKIAEVLQSVRAHAVLIENINRIYAFERDPNDEIFINLALVCKAEFLVSRDNDLLDLRKDESFKISFPQLRIVSPAEFLEIYREIK